ncbi:kinase-like domain-containing protein [Armillaria luteobubalina]|uniref:Kinase-like domain-containing protein n=1 Tax=Armillaria luteobubalina TaxID=153913 RepID=A0AA39Q5E6_9AGAR|nr:kinase-like domain-containing protein [Armillaria luteobubalina]
MCFKTLQDLSYNSGKLPPSLYINDVIRREEFPVGGGGFSDIWRGRSVSGEVVCLKILRTNITPDIEKLLRRCYKEILVWRTLRHSRILKFYGVYIISWENGVRFGLVSPWLENGCVMDYIKMHPDFDRMKAIREVVEGLQYLHRSERFAHGDIKGDNIFVKSDLTCCLGDFGLTTSAWTPAWPTKSSSTNGFGSMRWMAPELLSPKIFETQEGTRFDSDIYALGCTMLEILTGQVPWSEIEIDTQVLIEVIQGRTPNVPADISPAMSWILKHTWKFWPKHRPDIDWLKPKLEPSFRVPASVPAQSAISWFFQWILGVTSVTTKNSVTPVPAPSSSLQSNRSSPFQWNLGVTSATAKNSARTLWRSASKR